MAKIYNWVIEKKKLPTDTSTFLTTWEFQLGITVAANMTTKSLQLK